MHVWITSEEKAITPRLINECVFKTLFKKRPAAIAARSATSSIPAGNAENAPILKRAKSVEKKSGLCLSINTAIKIGSTLKTSKAMDCNACKCCQVHRLPDKHRYERVPGHNNNAYYSSDYENISIVDISGIPHLDINPTREPHVKEPCAFTLKCNRDTGPPKNRCCFYE